MTAAEVIRLPVRPRPRGVVSENGALAASGIAVENRPSISDLRVLANPRPTGGLAVLDCRLADGALDARQHAAAVAYGALRRRYERSGGPFRSWRDRSGLSDEAWQAVKRDHARLIRAARAERFVLDRLCLDDDVPLSSEMGRVRAALESGGALAIVNVHCPVEPVFNRFMCHTDRKLQRGSIVTRPAGLPSFQAPPLNEMAIGVQFMPCRGYNSLMATDVWNLFRADYPNAQEQPSTPPNFELFGPVQQPINFGFVQGPILNRFFFVSKNGDDVIQFQSDKLFHNWRRVDHEMKVHIYPRFEATFEKYTNELLVLNDFFQHTQGEPLSINQAEVTYVNHIDISTNLNPSEWLRYISPAAGKVDDFIGNFRRVLYDPDGKPEGRIICESNSATDHQGRPLIVMTLIARGAPKGTGVFQALEFLRKSRETVVSAFAELTTESAHRVWERTQ